MSKRADFCSVVARPGVADDDPTRWAPVLTRWAPGLTRWAPVFTRWAPGLTRWTPGPAHLRGARPALGPCWHWLTGARLLT
jgi:hypothetical protein